MQPRYDIRLSSTYINSNNDFEWFESDNTHIRDIIEMSPGAYKESPTDGVGINIFLNSASAENDVMQKVVLELTKDLYICNNPIVVYDNTGKLTIDANI